LIKPPSDSTDAWSVTVWRSRAKSVLTQRFSEPAAHLVAATGLTPNKVTIAGGFLSLGAGYLASRGHLTGAGVRVGASGALDLVDGTLARLTGKKTKFGAVLDSTVDRIGEAAVLFGLLALYSGLGDTSKVLLVFAAMVGSVLTSYIKARAEGVGLECNVGILTRGERVVIMALGLLLGQVPAALWTLALLSYVTAGQRLLQVKRAAGEEQ